MKFAYVSIVRLITIRIASLLAEVDVVEDADGSDWNKVIYVLRKQSLNNVTVK